MVETRIDNARQQGHIILSPNLSARWKTNVYLLYLVSTFTLAIGIAFALAGLWLILPFAGLEVIALVWIVYSVAHKCHRIEVIHLGHDKVRVERGYRKPQSSWQSDTFWIRMIIAKQERPWHPLRVFLRGRDDQIEIGAFLNEADKRVLIKELRHFVVTL